MNIDWAQYNTTEEEMKTQLSKVKVGLFTQSGAVFLASLLGQLHFKWDESAPTAWVDGISLAFNPQFFLSIPPKARITVLAHELWHVAFQHVLPDRRGDRDPLVWNIAADHVINLHLTDVGYSFEGIENCCRDRRFKGMTTEQVYQLIMDQGGPVGTSQDPMGHGDVKEDAAAGSNEVAKEIVSKVIQATVAMDSSRDAGQMPAEIQLSIDKLLNPILPWETLLNQFFTERSQDDYSWKRPSRRHDEYLPTLLSDNGLTKINYYLDISGSVSDGDIARFNTEVASIKNQFNPEELVLVTFDTDIHDEYTFYRDDPFERLVVTGRGGTDLDCVAQHILKTKPSVVVIFSDLYCAPMPFVGNIPVLWVVVGHPNASVPFGRMIHIRNE